MLISFEKPRNVSITSEGEECQIPDIQLARQGLTNMELALAWMALATILIFYSHVQPSKADRINEGVIFLVPSAIPSLPRNRSPHQNSRMSWSDSRFHAIANDSEDGSFIFARMRYPTLEILDADKAYEALASTPRARIAGCAKGPTEQLMSLLLSIPKSSARVSAGELQLRCMDKSSVELLVTLPIKSVPAKPLLQALHSCLMIASASIEGALLEIVGADMRTDIVEATPESLDVLHGPLIAGGQPVQLRSAFRRVAAADTQLHAARAFAVAQSAEKVREEILYKRKERQDQERKKRQRERERVREAKKLMLAGRGAKRPKRSLFDVENDSEKEEQSLKKTDKSKIQFADAQVASTPEVATTSLQQTGAREGAPSKQTATASSSTGDITQAERPQRTSAQSARREMDEPVQRKKKRKVRKLV